MTRATSLEPGRSTSALWTSMRGSLAPIIPTRQRASTIWPSYFMTRAIERALDIRERMLSPDHPDTAESLNNLASLLNKLGHASEAEPLFQKAIAIDEKTLSPTHLYQPA